ncbi:MAG: hypothetical protein R3E77_14590 [Steroidobacteraceae bacterium]
MPFSRTHFLHLAAVLGLLVALPVAAADHQHAMGQLLFFPSIELRDNGAAGEAGFETSDAVASVDILGSAGFGKFRVLGEFVASTDESDLERFQIGWEPLPDTLIWIGRFHQPASFWNSDHHHGQFLQTAITRPAAERWEDLGGIIPQHVEGLMIESRRALRNEAGLFIAFAAGISPLVGDLALQPAEIIQNRTGPDLAAYAARIDYLPHQLGENRLSLSVAHNEVGKTGDLIASTAFDHIDQWLYGASVNWNVGDLRILGTLYWLDTVLVDAVDPRHDGLLIGYLQIEAPINDRLAAFARHEQMGQAPDSRYLRLFPDVVTRRSAAGLRFALSRRNALSLELADTTTLQDDFFEARLQWSAAFP